MIHSALPIIIYFYFSSSGIYGCEDALKHFIHNSQVRNPLDNSCFNVNFSEYISSFLNTCVFQQSVAPSFGACTTECPEHAACKAMIYNTTASCQLCVNSSSTIDHTLDVQGAFIEMEMFKSHIGRNFHTSKSMNFSWCSDLAQDFHIGDFNGDGKDDFLCHQRTSGTLWPDGMIGLAYSPTYDVYSPDWQFEMSWCHHTDDELLVGDFNGDGYDDLLCHTRTTGYKQVALVNADGHFNGTSWESAVLFCYGIGQQLMLGDFNGDGRQDMICRQPENGQMWILLALVTGSFPITSPLSIRVWCYDQRQQLSIGDFNGDSRDDLFCYEPSNSYMWIILALKDESFSETDWWFNGFGWCAFPVAHVLADFNGDGRADILCHEGAEGRIWISYAAADGTFHITGEDDMDWCTDGEINVGDFDGDGRSDIVCKTTNTLCMTISDYKL